MKHLPKLQSPENNCNMYVNIVKLTIPMNSRTMLMKVTALALYLTQLNLCFRTMKSTLLNIGAVSLLCMALSPNNTL